MTQEHTSGEWFSVEFALSVDILSYKQGAPEKKLVAVVQSRNCDTPEEMKANGRLIAKAPKTKQERDDLLKAARKLCDDFGSNLKSHDTHRFALVEELKKAIARTETPTKEN